jgi:ABC-type molybdenum transport system ATPase subunit/photorepair protein PhrA
MRTVGALAAGEPGAWRAVKQAKDMPRQVLMARIGIHHRLLFRLDDGLDVLDLVTRGSLMTTLKHLRSS